MKIFLIAFFLVSTQVFSQSVCDRIADGVDTYLEARESRLSFKNRGGLINGGVCWWHNRFQRSSAYLAQFSPELPKPSRQELQTILLHLRQMSQVVTIPGFENFHSFSQAYEKEIQSVLEAWQRQDGFINQQWLRGISGQSVLSPPELRKRMDILYDQFVRSPHPIWVMAQIKGVKSHAFLISKMGRSAKGYDLQVIDSNFPAENKVFTYEIGQTSLKHPKDKYSFVPYLGFQKDFHLIKRSVETQCGKNLFRELETVPAGEVEVSHEGPLLRIEIY